MELNMEELQKFLGGNIATARKNQGFSIAEMAVKCQISEEELTAIEEGLALFKPDMLDFLIDSLERNAKGTSEAEAN